MNGFWMLCGATSGFLAVAIGAFGAHGLKARVGPEDLAIFETGARYQMYHALALVAVAPRPGIRSGGGLGVCGWHSGLLW